MIPVSYKEVQLEPVIVVRLGHERRSKRTFSGMFTDRRVDRKTVPEGKYAYDLRHDSDEAGPVSAEPFVRVNHFGTLVTDKPLPMDGDQYGEFFEIKEFWFD